MMLVSTKTDTSLDNVPTEIKDRYTNLGSGNIWIVYIYLIRLNFCIDINIQ